MAVVAPSSPDTQEPRPPKSDQENPASISQDASPLSTPATSVPPAAAAPAAPAPENPNPTPAAPVVTPPPPSIPSFTPSFRPVGAPSVPQFTPLANPNLGNPAYQSPGLQPPGVSAPPVPMVPVAPPGSGAVAVPVPPLQPPGVYQAAPGQMPAAAPGSYVQTPNGYMAVPAPVPHAPPAIPPRGIPRYPAPYPTMLRPGFPPRPLGAPIGVIPALSRPPIQGIRGVPSIMPPVVRPAVPVVAPTEKPQTTVYVGKIASTVENEFLESLLRLCGPVKSWKRAENPSDGTFRGFGFCEFESAEGVLRALRLLNRLNIDGQELVLNVNQGTREYLELYVDKKTEREKLEEPEAKASEKENGSPSGTEKQEPPTSTVDNSEENGGEPGDKEKQVNAQTFGIVNDEDRDADKDALEKLTSMIEERRKNKPLPPPPPMETASDAAKSNSEVPSKSRDGDSDVDIMKNDAAEDKKDEEMMSETRPTADHDRSETSSSDRARRRDRSRERDRDRERDIKREKERELERYERERERERVRREREREMKIREAERLYKDHVKEWEAREREKENQRQREIEREKERARERRREIKDQENESDDDDTRKRRHRSSVLEEKRRKRQREKEEDLADRLREEEEIAEAKKRAIEEHKQKEESNSSDQVNGDKCAFIPEEGTHPEADGHPDEQPYDDDDTLHENDTGDGILRNGNGNEIPTDLTTGPDVKQGNNVSSRKLGFGLMSSGKRTTVPSVFHEEDDEDMEKEKKMRPLVPIDYSTEELQAVQATASGTPPNLVAAAEFAKRITSVNPKEEKSDLERERSKRSNDRSSHRDRSRDDEEHTRTRDDNREKSHDKILHRGRDQEDRLKTVENKKLLDAKQLIDMIPKTKEKLFAYEINWDIYDKHELHERMRPWISKKITEFLGEEEATLVDYIVSSTREHVHASQMLELLQSILDDEAEMFVLKMWRMLIFEIKKVETGLNLKSKA